MELAKVTSKGQTTIPKAIRERLGIHEGDVLRFAVEGARVVVTKVRPSDAEHLKALESTLQEWLSPADDEAYRDL